MKLTGSSDPSCYNEKVRQDNRAVLMTSLKFAAFLGSLRRIRVSGIWGLQTTLQDWSLTLPPQNLILSQVSIIEPSLQSVLLM